MKRRREGTYVIEISRHATKRLHERLGLQRKSMERIVEKVYQNGVFQCETNGELYRYISGICGHSRRGTTVSLYGEKAFIFVDTKEKNDEGKNIIVLVTVIDIKNSFRTRSIQLRQQNIG